MRTKSMILGAALLAAGVASSMAQSNVYSLNVVGYVNVQLVNGFTCFANPLDFDGTGTNNTIVSVFGTNVPNGTTVYIWSGGGFNTSVQYSTRAGGWFAPLTPLNPGEGVFVSSPSNFTATVVGNVLQGTLTNQYITTGFSLVGSVIPVQNTIDSTGNGGLQYVPSNGDTVYFWDTSGQGWNTSSQYSTRGTPGWLSGDPVIVPGVGYFLSTSAPSPTWVTAFTVQ
jgi:hypothetical protein